MTARRIVIGPGAQARYGDAEVKLLDVADFFSERGGGVRSYLTTLATEGHRRGHEVVIIAPGPRHEVRPFHGGRLVRIAGPPMPYDRSYHLLWRIDRVLDVIERERPDVLQASSPYLPAFIVRSRRDVPIRSFVFHSDQIGTYVTPLVERIGRPFLTRGARRATSSIHRALTRGFDLTIAPSESIARQLGGAGCTNVHCLPFGVELERFGRQHALATMRRELLGPLATQPRAVVAVVAGRLALEKRVARIIDAVKLVNRTRPLALAIIGDGPERKRLEDHARKLPHVTFHGFVNDRARYASLLASADVFVHGGAAETFGFVLAEALASGLSVVVPSAGAAVEYTIDGLSETYEAYGSIDEMAAAILRAIDIPDDTRAQTLAKAWHGRLPFRKQAEHFDDLFGLYDSLLGGRFSHRRVAPPSDEELAAPESDVHVEHGSNVQRPGARDEAPAMLGTA